MRCLGPMCKSASIFFFLYWLYFSLVLLRHEFFVGQLDGHVIDERSAPMT